ncbi:MAG: 2,3-bisphosphoglycerate-independent phosphoglycerate mutase [Gloeomargaritaceae cyanobacterium C42_A2020_066]|nr:2,3-bisphosphoglycerate-independent phosphoglycerate mutase [Gloeomargaritaceae cyanobacterium C42_A2020_066]
MVPTPVHPVVLIILDGWGYREATQGNAIATAHTPIMDSLWAAYPHTLIGASGRDVGLPEGQMGNSEVGHLNIGAGRVVPQEFVRISDAAADGSFLSDSALVSTCQKVRAAGGKLHLIGLCSDGGVHAHLDHLYALVDLARAEGLPDLCIHAITDGRDTPPMSAKGYLHQMQTYLDRAGIGRIVTVSGRYYAMDRDKRWPRTEQAYRVLTQDGEGDGRSALDVVAACYAENITDEFIPPTRLQPGAIEPGDGIIFYNFRPDRMRQLVRALVDPNFQGFEREWITPLVITTFTEYDPSLPVSVVFQPQNLNNILGQVIAQHGVRQFRIAETEKYAHVTYFFNGGVETPFAGEERCLIPSPQVATYDQAPAMSAQAVTEALIAALEAGGYGLVVVNYANPDMVGHTGRLSPAVEAIEAVDHCLGQLLEAISRVGGTALITADHGNAEYMSDEAGNPWTAHTTNPVPFIVVEGEGAKIGGHGGDVRLRSGGRLADIAPTILQILKLPQPAEMTGRSLLAPVEAGRALTGVAAAATP